MILPRIFDVGGDMFAVGLELRNTDWGGTAASIAVFFERLICLNGMTSDKVFRQTHLGAKLDRDVDWSDKTRQLSRDASISAMKDVVQGFFAPERIDSLVGQLQAAGTVTISQDKLENRLKGKVPKDTARRIVELFNSADDVRVPARPTWMRAAQAVSAVAQDVEKDTGNGDTVLDMERLAGQLMSEGASLGKAA